MSDNLTVTIGADSSKLRAELALVSQATKAAQKELAALAAAFNKTGASADRISLDAKARQLDQYKRSAASLKQEIAGLSPTFARVGRSAEGAASGLQEFVHAGRGLGRVVGEFSSVGKGLQSFGGILGKLGGGFAGGLFGVEIGKAFGAILDQINETSKALRELRDQARDIGVKPIELQAVQNVAKAMGEDADTATKAMQGMSEQIDKIRKQSTQRIGDVLPVLRGGLGMGMSGLDTPNVLVRRAGQQPDLSKEPSEILGIANALRQIPNTELGKLQTFLLQLQAFQAQAKNFDPTALNMISKALFKGIPANTMLELAPKLLRETRAEIERLQKSPTGATPPALDLDAQLRKSNEARKLAFKEVTAPLTDAATRGEIALNEQLTASLTQLSETTEKFQKSGQFFDFSGFHKMTSDMSRWWDEALSAMSSSFSAWKDDFIAEWTAMVTDIEGLWTGLTGTISGVFNTISGWLKSIGASIGSAASNASSIGASLGVGMAGGGMVRGSGSGTSDSILARLSNGEFVMRAPAVQHWGPQFLASLNSLRSPGFALGGLVSSLGSRFAEGGLVGAGGGGTPVHLHLGGNTFALSGHTDVVNALVTEANRQQMRSAGTKPSWFAGKPGG